ncbi:hypothetical protein [Paenibacillus sp.]|uniref:hypothetical protein n=1 Tax=Paenibacillus sp. TaxID=58172 RepID=UPI002D5E4978|nr:hypothetical protein [Paenibacillus sp.]HZG85783.1 hypothetical protein [Paenibacillus sp.]
MIQFFATFDHSEYLELAISKLEEHDVTGIYAVPLEQRADDVKVVDTIHGTDGTSLVDLGLILAMMFGTIGVSRGYVLEWGPVFWGLIGAAGGFAAGFLIDLIMNVMKRKKGRTAKKKQTEVVLVVQCHPDQTDFVERTLWEHRAFGVAKTKIKTHWDGNPVHAALAGGE